MIPFLPLLLVAGIVTLVARSNKNEDNLNGVSEDNFFTEIEAEKEVRGFNGLGDACENMSPEKVKNLKARYLKITRQMKADAQYMFPIDMPNECINAMKDWAIIAQSPYGNSYYNTVCKSWSVTPENSYRVADHWNFYSQGSYHCTTNTIVPNNTHYSLCQYKDGSYTLIKSWEKDFEKEKARIKVGRKNNTGNKDLFEREKFAKAFLLTVKNELDKYGIIVDFKTKIGNNANGKYYFYYLNKKWDYENFQQKDKSIAEIIKLQKEIKGNQYSKANLTKKTAIEISQILSVLYNQYRELDKNTEWQQVGFNFKPSAKEAFDVLIDDAPMMLLKIGEYKGSGRNIRRVGIIEYKGNLKGFSRRDVAIVGNKSGSDFDFIDGDVKTKFGTKNKYRMLYNIYASSKGKLK